EHRAPWASIHDGAPLRRQRVGVRDRPQRGSVRRISCVWLPQRRNPETYTRRSGPDSGIDGGIGGAAKSGSESLTCDCTGHESHIPGWTLALALSIIAD